MEWLVTVEDKHGHQPNHNKGAKAMTMTQIKRRMVEIRDTLDRMAIEACELRWERLQLNQELGRIELVDVTRATAS